MNKYYIISNVFSILSFQAIQAQNVSININQASYTRPLLERLANEYSKEQPDFHLSIVNNGQADASIEIANETYPYSLGRIIVLPIVNSNNNLLQNKKIKKGLTTKIEQQLYVAPTYEQQLDNQEQGEKPLPGTVYSLANSKNATARLFAERLNTEPAKIRGKKILGREENINTTVRNHLDAVSFNVANLVYDIDSRQPVQGITVLPIDLDNNGRVSEEEISAITNLDTLTAYLAQNRQTGVAIGSITIRTDNDAIHKFVQWVEKDGQQYLEQYGYLRNSEDYTALK